MFLTTGIFGQFKVGGVVVVNEKGGILLEGCPDKKDISDNLLLLTDGSGNLISTNSFKGDVVEFDTSDLNDNNLTLTLISGDCKITKKIGK